jgi:hypothetical protein
MDDTAEQSDRSDDDAVLHEVPDEALERLARPPREAAYTVIMCTGGLECPF